MPLFTNHTIDSAPEGSKGFLEKAQKNLGFVPNLYGSLAESPIALEAYGAISDRFSKTSLSPTEQQVVLLVASVENGCEFCVAAHSVIAKKMVGVHEHIVAAIRNEDEIDDEKLESLAKFTREVVQQRGWVNGQPVENFLAAGYNRQQALEVILGVSLKTLSNYTNHMTETQTNAEFASESWTKSS